jgi:hypothetical protein
MMYGTGLPILYPFACIAYFILYWVYKGLLIKYYEKTTRFNEQLPIYSVGWIKLGICIHGVMGLFILTNSNLLAINDPYMDKVESLVSLYGGPIG